MTSVRIIIITSRITIITAGDQDNYGWKIISTDVFRFPCSKGLLASILGVGTQFLILSVIIIILALLGVFNVHR
jgi:transmembrane 9 superfamily protein 1